MKFKPATTTAQFKVIEKLAHEIMHEFYKSTIPKDHIDFFLETLQSVKAIQKQISEGGYEYYLIEYDENDVAYLGLQHKADILHISKLYILKEFRSFGIGEEAMKLIKKRASELAVSRLELVVNRKNTRGIKFYERHGFQVEKELVHCFDNGHCEEDYGMANNLKA